MIMSPTKTHIATLPARLDERLYWVKIMAALLLVILLAVVA